MLKSELIAATALAASVENKVATTVIEAHDKIITDTLAKGEEVKTGLGIYKVSQRAERKGRNPQTGEAITIAASTVPVFKAGKALKNIVNGKKK